MFYILFTKADVPDEDIWYVADNGFTLARVDGSGFIVHSDGVPSGSYDIWDHEDSGAVISNLSLQAAITALEERHVPERVGY